MRVGLLKAEGRLGLNRHKLMEVSNQWLISDKTLPSVKFSRRLERLAKTHMMTPRRFAPDSVLLVRVAFRAIASEQA